MRKFWGWVFQFGKLMKITVPKEVAEEYRERITPAHTDAIRAPRAPNKKLFGEMLNAKNKKKFREAHSSEITVYETAVKFLKGRYTDGKIPSMKALQQEKQNLIIRRNAQQNSYNYLRDYANELKTVCSNVDAILNPWEEKEVKRTRQ